MIMRAVPEKLDTRIGHMVAMTQEAHLQGMRRRVGILMIAGLAAQTDEGRMVGEALTTVEALTTDVDPQVIDQGDHPMTGIDLTVHACHIHAAVPLGDQMTVLGGRPVAQTIDEEVLLQVIGGEDPLDQMIGDAHQDLQGIDIGMIEGEWKMIDAVKKKEEKQRVNHEESLCSSHPMLISYHQEGETTLIVSYSTGMVMSRSLSFKVYGSARRNTSLGQSEIFDRKSSECFKSSLGIIFSKLVAFFI